MAVTHSDPPKFGVLSNRKLSKSISRSNVSGLKSTFDMFNEVTEKLEETYGELEKKIDFLSAELQDVESQRKDELQKKRELSSQLEQILNVLPGGIIVLDGDGVINRVNPAASKLLNVPQTNLLGAKWSSVIDKSFDPRADDGHEISLKNGKRASISITPLGNDPGQIIQLIDQTETRLLQDRLAHHQRLSDMGRMVASLAHQIRTPLSAAMLYCSNLVKPDIKEAARLKFAKKIQQRLHHLEQQVKDMLLFAKGKVALNDRMSAEQLIEDIKTMTDNLQDRAKFNFSLHPLARNKEVLANRDALLGAIINLINNGIEACDDDAEIEIDIFKDSHFLVTKVLDNGIGLTNKDLKKLSEPFYTTKSHGTGLGLPVVNSIALAHYGAFSISQRADRCGAEASIKIPIVNQTDLFGEGDAYE